MQTSFSQNRTLQRRTPIAKKVVVDRGVAVKRDLPRHQHGGGRQTRSSRILQSRIQEIHGADELRAIRAIDGALVAIRRAHIISVLEEQNPRIGIIWIE